MTYADIPGAFVTPLDFGGSCDGTVLADETEAIQAAIDSFAGKTGTVYLPFGCLISDTLRIDQTAVTLMGSGWGRANNTPRRGFLRWVGSPDLPMVKISNALGAGIENLRLIGNSLAKPSCGLQIHQDSTSAGVLLATYVRRLYIGQMYGYDLEPTSQFKSGIVFSGTINGDSNTLQHVRITTVDDYGVDVQNPNASDTHFDGLFIQNTRTAIRTKARVSITNATITNSADWDIELETGGEVHAHHYVSESSARLCRMNGPATKLILLGGGFQACAARTPADGVILDTQNHGPALVHLQDFALQRENGFAGPIKFRMYNTAGGTSAVTSRVINTWGINPSNLDLGPIVWTNDSRNIIYRPAPESSQDAMPSIDWRGRHQTPAERTLRSWASDAAGELNHYGGPFRVRKLAPPSGPVSASALLGTGSEVYSYRVSALTYDGETLASTAVTCTNGPLDASHVNRIAWPPIPGAVAFRIYGRTSGAEQLLKTVTWDDLHPNTAGSLPNRWDDDGSFTPSGALPTANTTGNAMVEGSLTLGALATSDPHILGRLWNNAGAVMVSAG